MKSRFIKAISVFLSASVLCAAFALPAAVSAADTPQSHITEIAVKKAEILSKGAFKAIQAALNSARYCATKDNIYKSFLSI